MDRMPLVVQTMGYEDQHSHADVKMSQLLILYLQLFYFIFFYFTAFWHLNSNKIVPQLYGLIKLNQIGSKNLISSVKLRLDVLDSYTTDWTRNGFNK